jgi:hypothetical protein
MTKSHKVSLANDVRKSAQMISLDMRWRESGGRDFQRTSKRR